MTDLPAWDAETLRDKFAMAAMQGLLANAATEREVFGLLTPAKDPQAAYQGVLQDLAIRAYDIAQVMLAERAERGDA